MHKFMYALHIFAAGTVFDTGADIHGIGHAQTNGLRHIIRSQTAGHNKRVSAGQHARARPVPLCGIAARQPAFAAFDKYRYWK